MPAPKPLEEQEKILLAALDSLLADIFAEVKQGLLEVAEDVSSRAETKEAPIQTGHLRESISAEGQFILARAMGKLSITTRVRADTVYAAVQHENRSYDHPLGGRAKYFTDPAKENKDRYTAFVAKRAARGLKKAEARAK